MYVEGKFTQIFIAALSVEKNITHLSILYECGKYSDKRELKIVKTQKGIYKSFNCWNKILYLLLERSAFKPRLL
ncbi:MAG: hypothetical protein A2W93_13670 [Bacteroidetes bacterium GWF2_43_63]|nr:MAG: hypothetical protein A2W94_03865 [Bacteroidetes bacterium GWE2_42_42]OFY55037.1 MAG: hypothetical protein A2W93_13670 [Bacteroidetes bacterium GWF2_43_63]HBG69574.1 hypothetical protein [Bacteroidales bacterium]HCB60687.1 hypothetical protein [Bacteroidales bacterium]HCY24009.1 hypothetical protein [Bacteroidales bacterium]